MPTVNIQIKNLPQIKRAFGQAPTLMRRNLSKAMNQSILTVGRKSVMAVTSMGAVDTGRMRASIMGGGFTGGSFRSNIGVGLSNSSVLTASVGPTVDYAIYVHEGTRRMRPRRFMNVGVDQSIADVDRFMTEAVQSTLNTIGKMT